MTILIDTNLLVLLVVGFAAPEFIERHKRTRAYSVEDFVLLKDLLASSLSVCTTPHILSEASNLARQFAEPGRSRIAEAFRMMLTTSSEIPISSVTAAEHPGFRRLGLTDSGVIVAQQANPRTVLLTDDLDLYLASASAGLKAINFTYWRDAEDR